MHARWDRAHAAFRAARLSSDNANKDLRDDLAKQIGDTEAREALAEAAAKLMSTKQFGAMSYALELWAAEVSAGLMSDARMDPTNPDYITYDVQLKDAEAAAAAATEAGLPQQLKSGDEATSISKDADSKMRAKCKGGAAVAARDASMALDMSCIVWEATMAATMREAIAQALEDGIDANKKHWENPIGSDGKGVYRRCLHCP